MGERVLCPYSERPMNGNVNKLMLMPNVHKPEFGAEIQGIFVTCFTDFRETCVKSAFSCG
jgi:hypothetical protein